MISAPQSFPVHRVFLDLSNPRHEPYQTEAEVIDYLCREELVYELAKDIVDSGLDPLELFALIPVKAKKGSVRDTFVVADGNRRLCAIKLLHDPDLAPTQLREGFEKLKKRGRDFSEILGITFTSRAEADPWLAKLHGGAGNGVGRRTWDAEQKARHFGDPKNALALAVLDYAEERGFISSGERKGKLTTAQRYLGNSDFRSSLGIEGASGKDIARNRPNDDVDTLVSKFVKDLVNGTVNSRAKVADITAYSKKLIIGSKISGKRVPSVTLSVQSGGRKRKRRASEPNKPKFIPSDEVIGDALKGLVNYKLERLYYSICNVALDKHTPLVAVGVWSFFETLTACAGRDPSTSFSSFISKSRLDGWGITGREQKTAITQAIQRITDSGNTTKHHTSSATFNSEQLANDVGSLGGVILKLIAQAKATV